MSPSYHLEEDMASKSIIGRRQAGGLENVLLPKYVSFHSCGCYFDVNHLPKHSCRQCICFHGNDRAVASFRQIMHQQC